MRIKYKTIKTLPRKTTQPTLDYIALNFKRGKQYQYVTTLHKLQSSKWSPNSRNEYLLSQGEVIRMSKSKTDSQHNGQKKRTKEQTTIYKTLHRKLKIEQHEPHLKLE
jgi:hypothetical protein